MTLTTLAQKAPRVMDFGIRLDRLPAVAWLALQAAALLPTWIWMGRRLLDRSDDPLGAVAICALGAMVWCARHDLRAAPRLGWLALATVGTLAATLLRDGAGAVPAWPPLAVGLVAVLAFASGLLAFLPRQTPAAPVAGLAVLALPLLSSLQFYAGFPLRVVTAEASRWLLAPAFSVVREGTSLVVDGRLVIVDAPCSGIQMAWLGYFTACAVALWARRDDRSFLQRLPVVGLLVLSGNIVRNAILVAFEAADRPLAPWLHAGLGLVLLAGVCGTIARVMAPQLFSRILPRESSRLSSTRPA
ncbi:MAG: exosortase Q [Gammaproteobacteria bacterium]|nr:exosortase Q [Gammaproteobacteria bacterium]MBU1442103.1 exosortase Q [Gammaproteobacteria bacterium]